MLKNILFPVLGVMLIFSTSMLGLTQPVKALGLYWSETWHHGIWENYPGYPQNISNTETVNSGDWWVKAGLDVSIYEYEYESWLGVDAVYFRAVLYFDSFAEQGLYPVYAERVTFIIEKDATGSNLIDQAINIQEEDPNLYPGVSQGCGLVQSMSTGSSVAERQWWGLKPVANTVALFCEPLSVAMWLIDAATAFAPDSGPDFDNANWGQTIARSRWSLPEGGSFGSQNPVRQYAFNTFRWAQHIVNPDTFYGIRVYAHIELPSPNPLGVNYIDTPYVYLTIYRYNDDGGGGGGSDPGCPILYVNNGAEYFCEGLLNIHNTEGIDVVRNHTLMNVLNMPQPIQGTYLFSLIEHPYTHSYIDQVKLYAMFADGTMIRLPLIWAWHSEKGIVLPQLMFSDNWRTDTLGAIHNNGTSQSINLKFLALPPYLRVAGFIFEIEGHNWEFKP